jgi:lactoylglutathione lyase
VAGTKQLKVGFRVSDLEASCALYLRLGFRQIPHPDQPNLRYLTFGHTWSILSDRYAHGYHNSEREDAAKSGALGNGVVLAVPTHDLDGIDNLWRREGLRVTLEPEDAAKSGALGSGVVLAVPTHDLDGIDNLWRREGPRVTLEPEDVFYARIFYGLDPDGYELMFEQHHPTPK